MYIVTIILCEVGLYCCEYPLNDPPPFFSGLSLVYRDLPENSYIVAAPSYLSPSKILVYTMKIIVLGTSTGLNTENIWQVVSSAC